MDMEEIIALRKIVNNFIVDTIEMSCDEFGAGIDEKSCELATENILIYMSKRYNLTIKEGE